MERLLDTKDVANLLNRSPGAVRNLVLRRKIPFRKVAGRLAFIKDEIEEWIAASPGIRLEELHASGTEAEKRGHRSVL